MTTLIEDHGSALISIGDTRSYCADCGGELGMLRITKGYLRLGHVKEPPTLHAPRLRLARSASQPPSLVTVAGQNREPNARGSARTGDEAPSEPGDRTSVPLRPHRADTDGDIGDPSSGR